MYPPAYPAVRKPLDSRKKVIVTGSKTMLPDHWAWVCKMLDRAIFPLDDPIIMSFGHSEKLVDKFAVNWASQNWLALKIYYLDEHRKSKRKADLYRRMSMLKAADYMVVLWDGYCPWSEAFIEEAKERSVKVKAFVY